MSEHDPLCVCFGNPDPLLFCECDIIDKTRLDEASKRHALIDKATALAAINEHLIRADERQKIAQAIEEYAVEMDERWGHLSLVLFNAAKIARNGGRDE